MYLLSILNPLIISIFIAIFGRYLGKEGSKRIGSICLLINTILGLGLGIELMRGKEMNIQIFKFIQIGERISNINIELDKLGISMIWLISIITLIVYLYSSEYMKQDSEIIRFYSLLLGFSGGMLILISNKDLIILYIGWEIIGIISYFLINYWYTRIESNKSAMVAVLYNKIGDICLLLWIATYDYNYYPFLIIASAAKSAQIFFSGWLSLAMAGPTPVSSLLHSATMVTSGVYLLLRNDMVHSDIKEYILLIGGITIVYGGLKSLYEKEIKRIIAYSTCSQIGYMYISSIYNDESSLFHLMSHSHFKALLFMTAGLIIHSYMEEQDIRRITGIIYKNPLLYIYWLIGTMSIIGLPFLSGFYSKENIIENGLSEPLYLYLLTILGGGLTTLYSLNLLKILIQKNNYILSNKFISNDSEINTFLKIIYLILGSIWFSYILKDFYIGIGNKRFDVSYIEFESGKLKLIPLIILIILSIYSIKYKSLISKRYSFGEFDLLYNKFAISFLNYGYSYIYKSLERGLIDPLSYYRLILKESKKEWPLLHYSNKNYIYILVINILILIFLYIL